MRQFFGSGRGKALIAFLGGGGMIAASTGHFNQDQKSFNFSQKFSTLHAAEIFTHSVVDTKFQRTPIPWDQNWDRREPEALLKPLRSDASDEDREKRAEQVLQNAPKAKRIVILVRHGQYNEKGQDDAARSLTELGREQADMTGKRLAELFDHYQSKMAKDEDENQNKLELKFIQSTMTRATETAEIILRHFPGASADKCDLIREGAPCEPVPAISPLLWNPSPQVFFEDSARIEAGFRKYIHRADPRQKTDSVDIIVCHANVIRYFVCRALQLPPEAWLRFSLHNGSFTVMSIQPNGRVSISILGEAGHFPVEKMTFN